MHCISPLLADQTMTSDLSSSYIPTVKRLPATTRTSRGWCPETEEALRCCFEIAEWDMFCDEYEENIDGLVECITH